MSAGRVGHVVDVEVACAVGLLEPVLVDLAPRVLGMGVVVGSAE